MCANCLAPPSPALLLPKLKGTGMTPRGISERHRTWLAGEVEAWRARGLVSTDQAAGILALYGTSEERAEHRRSKSLLVLMGAAAFLVGLGVLLLIGYNWQGIPIGGKLAIIFGTILGVHGLGLHLRFRAGRETGSEVAFFLGGLLYGAGIMLIAQIFHLNAHYPDGVWWWALGVLPFALTLRTPLLHVLLVALLALWCGLEVIGDPGRGDWLFGRPAFLPNGAYTLPLLVLPGFIWAYRRHSPATVGLYVPLVVWWTVLQPIAWRFEWNTVFFLGVMGGGLLLVAGQHAAGSAFAIPYRFFGTALAAGVLVPVSFHEFLKDRARTDQPRGLLLTFLLATVVLLVPILVARRRPAEGGDGSEGHDLLAVVRRQWLPASLVLLMLVIQALSTSGAGTVPAVILANVAMLVLAFWLMHLGLREDRGRPFSAGVLYFLLWAILRYVDLFGDMGGMLGAAAMFFVCGAALFGVAQFWRRRKRGQHA